MPNGMNALVVCCVRQMPGSAGCPSPRRKHLSIETADASHPLRGAGTRHGCNPQFCPPTWPPPPNVGPADTTRPRTPSRRGDRPRAFVEGAVGRVPAPVQSTKSSLVRRLLSSTSVCPVLRGLRGKHISPLDGYFHSPQGIPGADNQVRSSRRPRNVEPAAPGET